MNKRLIVFAEKEKEEELENLFIIKGFSTRYYIEKKEDGLKAEIYGEEKELRDLAEILKDKVKNMSLEDKINLWTPPKRLLPYELIEGVIINPAPENIIITLVPGLAFGTGRHESTKIAAKLLTELNLKEKSVLDIGCGSGILSVLSKKIGARYVKAVDSEPQAIEKTRETAKLNETEIDVSLSDLLQNVEGKYDIIIANILPEVLKKLLIQLPKVLKRESNIIFSGIYDEEHNTMKEVISKYSFKIIKEEELNNWYGFLFKMV